jgi:hypothetical protein
MSLIGIGTERRRIPSSKVDGLDGADTSKDRIQISISPQGEVEDIIALTC